MSNSIFNSIPHVVQGWQTLIENWNRPSPLYIKPSKQLRVYASLAISGATMVIYAFATPVLTLFDFIYTHAQRKLYVTNKDGGCDNLFSTPLIIEYKSQLTAHFHSSLLHFPEINKSIQKDNKSPLVTALVSFLTILEKDAPSLNSSKERKSWFNEMTRAFRTLSLAVDGSKEEISSEIRQCLEMWSNKRYLELDLLDSLETLHLPYTKGLTLNTLSLGYNRMKQDKALRCNGAVLDLFDAHSFGNVPFALPSISLQGGHSVDMIRMPSITKDLNKNSFTQSTNEVAIIEEFQWFLNSLTSKNKCHFYVNLMDRTHGNESIRSQAIEDLDQQDSAPIKVLTLDKDSDFYMQTGQFNSEKVTAKSFKETFQARILTPCGHYYLPKGTPKELITYIIESTHQESFPNKLELNRNERLEFIELVYCRLIEALAIKHNVNSMNISCKHCIDRGANQNFIFMNYLRFQNKTNIADSQLITLLFSPAIMVANRPIRQHYMKRAQLLYQKLQGINK